VPQRPMGRKSKTSSRKTPASATPRPTLVTEPVIQQSGDLNRASVTFAIPVSSVRPSSSTAQDPVSSVQHHASDPQAAVIEPSTPFFTTHHVLEDLASAATEAIRQAGLMMQRVKTVHENSQAAYDASAALRANVQVSWLLIELLS